MLEEAFRREFGPSEESTYQALQRGYKGFTNRIYNNIKMTYDEQRDIFDKVDSTLFNPTCFKLRSSDNIQLSCCYCENKSQINIEARRIIIFMHTNTRNLLQGLDILKVCTDLKASLLTYDLRGCGKSDGPGLNNLDTHLADLDLIIRWARSKMRGNSISSASLAASAASATQSAGQLELIFWARGMSCATVIYHASNPLRRPAPHRLCDYPVKFIVLDSPYVSIEQMVLDCLAHMRRCGYYLPDAVLNVGASLVRNSLSSKLKGMDPFDVRPADHVELIGTPCCILIATEDDYVPIQQGLEIASRWLGPAQSRQINNTHFGPRTYEQLAWIVPRMQLFLVALGDEPLPTVVDPADPAGSPVVRTRSWVVEHIEDERVPLTWREAAPLDGVEEELEEDVGLQL